MWKDLVFMCLCLSLAISAYGLNDSSQWANAIHVNRMLTSIHSVEQTFDGGFVAAGQEQINDRNNVLFIRLNSAGELQWANSYGSKDASIYANATLQTSDGGFVFVGGTDGDQALVVKLDVAGNILWQNAFASFSSREEARAIIRAADGGFFLLGNSRRSKQSDVWCMKLSSYGSVLWQKIYVSEKDQLLSSAVATSDGGLIFVGRTGGIDKPNVMLAWVVRLNPDGDIVWQKKYGHEVDQFEHASAVATTADGGSVVGGYSITWPLFGVRFWRAWALKLDANGAMQWQRHLRNRFTYDTIDLSGIRQERDGHILLMGTDEGVIWTARLDTTGKMFWDEAFGKSDVTSFDLMAIHDTRDDGTILTGTRTKESRMDGLVAKTSSDGMVCNAFLSRRSLNLFSPDFPLNERPTHAKIKENTFAHRAFYLTQAPAHVKITDLCARY